MYPARDLPSFKKMPSAGSSATQGSPPRSADKRPMAGSQNRPPAQSRHAAGRKTPVAPSRPIGSGSIPKTTPKYSISSDRVLSGRIKRRSSPAKPTVRHSSSISTTAPATTRTAGKSPKRQCLAHVSLDEFFDEFAHHSHAEVAARFGVTTSYVGRLLSVRTTQKGQRDQLSRKSVKDELNVRRAANGVISSARNGMYASRGEHCGHFLDPDVLAATYERRRALYAKSSASVSNSQRSLVAGPGTGKAKKASNQSMMSAGLESGRGAERNLANFRGHEIYEIDDYDLGEDELEEYEIGEDDLEEGEIRE